MVRIAAAGLIGICFGVAVVSWRDFGNERSGADAATEDRVLFERFLSELERSLALERYERQALADEVASLLDSMAELQVRAVGDGEVSHSGPRLQSATTSSGDNRGAPPAERIREPIPESMSGNPEVLDQFLHQQQFDRFIAAGITPERAHAIMQREENLEMEALSARHAATRSGATPEDVVKITPLSLLRSELGDADYAKYLDARGRPTSIKVRDIVRSSPAEISGLMPGDEVVAYNGQRVFDLNELVALAQEADAGSPVPLEMIRDGQAIQVYVKAGPLGIISDGRFSGL